MKVYKVQGDLVNGPCVWGEVGAALREVEFLLSEGSKGFGVRVEIDEMTEEELDALDEFEGY